MLVYSAVVLAILVLILFLSGFLTRRRPTPEKERPYECGVMPAGDPRLGHGIPFFLMPGGRYVTEDARYALPQKAAALTDIEALIHHFVTATRGPRLPAGEAYAATEAPRGEQGYYLVSDGGSHAYRLRIRTPGFANIQALPLLAKGARLADFVAILASYDYILPDIDR